MKFIQVSKKFMSLPNDSRVNQAAAIAILITIAPVIHPPILNLPVEVLNPLKSKMINGKKPLTKFGMEIAAVALRFVPNCTNNNRQRKNTILVFIHNYN
jgi:hypothetical protein